MLGPLVSAVSGPQDADAIGIQQPVSIQCAQRVTSTSVNGRGACIRMASSRRIGRARHIRGVFVIVIALPTRRGPRLGCWGACWPPSPYIVNLPAARGRTTGGQSFVVDWGAFAAPTTIRAGSKPAAQLTSAVQISAAPESRPPSTRASMAWGQLPSSWLLRTGCGRGSDPNHRGGQ